MSDKKKAGGALGWADVVKVFPTIDASAGYSYLQSIMLAVPGSSIAPAMTILPVASKARAAPPSWEARLKRTMLAFHLPLCFMSLSWASTVA